jgi:hypothetical protein
VLAIAGATLGLVGCSAAGPNAGAGRSGTIGANAAPKSVADQAEFNLTSNPSDEPMLAYVDPNNQFRFLHPAAWAKSTQAGEAVRVTGRDQYMSVAVVSTSQAPVEFATADTQQVSAASTGFRSSGPKAHDVAGKRGAILEYTWQAGPSPVTGKPVPSVTNRYYIPGPANKLAIFTYTSAAGTFDREDAEDFGNTFQWLS